MVTVGRLVRDFQGFAVKHVGRLPRGVFQILNQGLIPEFYQLIACLFDP